MDLVIVESPYAGYVSENVKYAKACVVDCLKRGEAPYASHLFFTQDGILDDLIPEERKLGIDAGFAWALAAKRSAFYIDRGISPGMRAGVQNAVRAGRDVVIRSIEGEVSEQILSTIDSIVRDTKKTIQSESPTGPDNRNSIESVIAEASNEMLRAEAKFARFSSRHEAYAVLLEEVDEMWHEIKSNNHQKTRKEAVQVAAVALRILRDF